MIFQTIYDWIKNLQTPEWLKEVHEIIKSILATVSKELWSTLTTLVFEASKNDQLTPEGKFKYVVEEFKQRWGGVEIKDSILNLLLELAVQYLKVKSVI